MTHGQSQGSGSFTRPGCASDSIRVEAILREICVTVGYGADRSQRFPCRKRGLKDTGRR